MALKTILIDGSNVLFWRGGQSDIEAVRLAVQTLRATRFTPIIYFDHSVTRLASYEELLAALGAPATDLIIAARGTSADALLLAHADADRVQIVSRDRFRQWAGLFPRLRGDWLVTGRIEKGGRVSFSKKLKRPPA